MHHLLCTPTHFSFWAPLTFLCDVLVCKQEHHLLVLRAQLIIQHLQVVTERLLVIASTQLDLKHLAPRGERGQLTQALLAAATDAHQQGVALVHTDDAVDTRQMLQGIVKQYKVHGCVAVIVLLSNLKVEVYKNINVVFSLGPSICHFCRL